MPGIGVFSGSGEIGDDRMIEFRMNAIRSGVAEKRPIPFLVRGACTAPIFRQPRQGRLKLEFPGAEAVLVRDDVDALADEFDAFHFEAHPLLHVRLRTSA